MPSRSKEATLLKRGDTADTVRLYGLEIGCFLAKIWLTENYIYHFDVTWAQNGKKRGGLPGWATRSLRRYLQSESILF